MVEVRKIMAKLFRRYYAGSTALSAPTIWQGTANPWLCRKVLHIREVWVSLLWDHCSFLLGPGVHKVLFVPFKSLFLQSSVSSSSSLVG